MNYKYSTITIEELLGLAKSGRIDFSPAYQRGFIWSLADQKDLVKTISKGYPLPNLFIRVLENGMMEMVDGQQRSRTILKFHNNEIKFTSKDNIEVCSKETFIKYTLQVAYIYDTTDTKIREIYYYINKKGINLNDPERQKAYYNDTLFLKLSEELAKNQLLVNLDLFTDKSINRLNDREFIQELVGYLYMYNQDVAKNINTGFEGLRDKKIYIEKEMFLNDITQDEYELLDNQFKRILQKLTVWDEIYPINKTRFRQKNDFFTMFCFLNQTEQLNEDIFEYQYKLLLHLNQKDRNGDQLIRPTNEDCDALKNYAINCVSQSNSKRAREERLSFWRNILLNELNLDQIDRNPTLLSILTYFDLQYGEGKVDLIKIDKYYLLDINLLNK